jgi:HK97 family phage major capsid protein
MEAFTMRRDDILALKEQRAHLHKEMVDLFGVAEGDQREFTAEENEKYDKMEGEFRSLTKRWEQAEELYNREKEVKRSLETPIELRVSDDDDVPQTLSEYRAKTRGVQPWDTPEYRSAWFHYLTVRNQSALDVEEQRVLSKASAGAGANLVPTSFYDQIINILRFMGPINQLASTMTTDSGEALQVPAVSAHGVATWTAENAGYTASDETFGQITLNAFKAGRTVIVSEELLTDAAFGLDNYLAQELGASIGVLEETAFSIGDGSGKPLGLATTGNGVTVSQAAAAGGNVTTFSYSAIAAFLFALPYQYRRNAVWIFADTSVRNLYTMVDSQQRPLWAVNVANTGPDTFLGKPVYTSPDLAVPAASAKSGIFGDIGQAYQIRRVNGFSLQRQTELYSNNGQVGFRGFERVDGRIRNAAAAIVLQHAAT